MTRLPFTAAVAAEIMKKYEVQSDVLDALIKLQNETTRDANILLAFRMFVHSSPDDTPEARFQRFETFVHIIGHEAGVTYGYLDDFVEEVRASCCSLYARGARRHDGRRDRCAGR